VPIIKTAEAFFKAMEIAESDPRDFALGLGGEDIAMDIGAVPSPETLFLPKQYVQIASRAGGLMPLCTIGTVADFQDLEVYCVNAERSRQFCFEGSSCIHSSVVPLLNKDFILTANEVDEARRVVRAYDEAELCGSGAIIVEGKMIDVPVGIRAQPLLDRYAALGRRDQKCLSFLEFGAYGPS